MANAVDLENNCVKCYGTGLDEEGTCTSCGGSGKCFVGEISGGYFDDVIATLADIKETLTEIKAIVDAL